MSQDELEKRRLKAAGYFKSGKANGWICKRLGVCHGTVTEWHGKWKTGGTDALLMGKYGRISKLSPEEEKKIQDFELRNSLFPSFSYKIVKAPTKGLNHENCNTSIHQYSCKGKILL